MTAAWPAMKAVNIVTKVETVRLALTDITYKFTTIKH